MFKNVGRTGQLFSTLAQMLVLAWRAHPLCLVSVLTIQGIQGIIPIFATLVSGSLYNALVSLFQGIPFAQLLQGFILLLVARAALSIVEQILTPIRDYIQKELERQFTLSMRTTLYEKLNNFQGFSHFEDPHFHNALETTTNMMQYVPSQALDILVIFFQNLITLMAFASALLFVSPLLALILCISVLPHLFASLNFSRKRFLLQYENSPRERRASYYGQVLSGVPFAKEVRLFQLGNYFLRQFQEAIQQVYSAQRKLARREVHWRGLLALFSSLIGTGAFVVVVMQVFSKHIRLGDMVIYLNAVEQVQLALMMLILSISQMKEHILFFQKYQEILTLDDCIVHTPTPCQVPPLERGITFRNVSFRYSEQHPWMLRHLDMFLPVGRCVALVGLNGAGKTTLVKLLCRLYDPTEGQVLWDDIDIREFDVAVYRRQLGAIFQDFAHYDLSAQENIGLGETSQIKNLEAIEHVAKMAGLHDRIVTLSHGYQSMLSRWMADGATDDHGVDLSGGEWQKLALARMFLRNSPVLILDEPTAALDAQSEYDLFCQFHELMQGHTCLLITHRFSTVRMADSIAVLEHGHISAYGSHEALMTYPNQYARLYTIQAQSFVQALPHLSKEP
jgi:ATP-binding cassette subfamily B protein